LVGNCNFFLPLAFNAPVGGVPIGIPGKIGPHKTRIMGLSGSEDSLTNDDRLSHFEAMPACDGQPVVL